MSGATRRAGRGRTLAAIAIAFVSTATLAVAWGAAIAYGIPVGPSGIALGIAGVTFGLVGAVIIARVQGNRLGWVFGGISVAMTLSGFQSVARPLLEAGMDTSLVAVGQGLADASFSTMLFLVLVITPSWFPTGQPLTRRWGWPNLPAAVAWVVVVMMALLSPEKEILWDPSAADPWRAIPNPIGVSFFPHFEDSPLAAVASLVLLGAGIAAVTSLVVRYRRSAVVERAQIRLLLLSFLILIPSIVVSVVLGDRSTGLMSILFEVLFGAAILAVPIAAGVAIAKYRLYDVDVVVSRALTFGVLAVFITGVYAVVVVGVGSLVGGGDGSGLALSIVAVTLVAVVFEPVRRRVQHWANVVVYGKRATPYEVLSSATTRLAETSDPDEALARLTSLIGQGTGAAEVVVWLVVGEVMVPRSGMPDGVLEGLVAVPVPDDVASLSGDLVVPVRYGGEVLGAISLVKARGDVVSGSDVRVVGDVAAGAGVLLWNMGLNAELVERAGQLRVSRRRLVAAHDAERHRLERDLHDGAQQQVVALKVKLGIARTLAEREGAGRVAGLVGSLAETTQEAVDGMRAIAHGIYPPLLEAEGLVAALGASARTVRVPVEVVASGVGRYDRSVEEGVYFAVLDTVNRAVGAGASRAVVSLEGVPDMVRFTVDVDAAPGDLVAVEDRIDALDGTLTLSTDTTRQVITGTVPVATHTMEPT